MYSQIQVWATKMIWIYPAGLLNMEMLKQFDIVIILISKTECQMKVLEDSLVSEGVWP